MIIKPFVTICEKLKTLLPRQFSPRFKLEQKHPLKRDLTVVGNLGQQGLQTKNNHTNL